MAYIPIANFTGGEVLTAAKLQQFLDNYYALSKWTQRAYSGGNFTAGAATWTVDTADQRTFAYKWYDKTMEVHLSIGTTTFSGTSNELSISIPESKVATREMIVPCRIINNSVAETGYIFVQPSGTVIKIRRADDSNFTTPQTNTLSIASYIKFEIN